MIFRLTKTEESNYSNSLSAFQEFLCAANQKHKTNETIEHQVTGHCFVCSDCSIRGFYLFVR